VIRSALLAAAVLATALAAPAAAQCRLALVLALDISSSVNDQEYQLQKGGLALAFRDPEVRNAILGPGGGIEVAVMEWSGYQQQDVMVDWTFLANEPAIDAFAARVDAHKRPYGEFATAIGKAAEFAMALLQRADPTCDRRVIDFSGDGENNDGVPPRYFASQGLFDGVTINGLTIFDDFSDPTGYYQRNVIHGPDAFVERAYGFENYGYAIKRKLLREIGEHVVIGQATP
jgi:hypothetical protein